MRLLQYIVSSAVMLFFYVATSFAQVKPKGAGPGGGPGSDPRHSPHTGTGSDSNWPDWLEWIIGIPVWLVILFGVCYVAFTLPRFLIGMVSDYFLERKWERERKLAQEVLKQRTLTSERAATEQAATERAVTERAARERAATERENTLIWGKFYASTKELLEALGKQDSRFSRKYIERVSFKLAEERSSVLVLIGYAGPLHPLRMEGLTILVSPPGQQERWQRLELQANGRYLWEIGNSDSF